MLIPAHTTFAIRCPQCGRLETSTVSRFAFSGAGGSVKVACSCGSHKLSVSARAEQVAVQLPCYLCDGLHFLYFSPRNFWKGHLKPVACPETDLQLGVFGPEAEVEVYARTGGTELDRLMDDEAFGEYFDHPVVMFEALSRVHNMAEEGRLSCVCGNDHIAVDIYPERLELCCPDCGRRKTIMAARDEDLTLLETAAHLEVGDDAPGRRKGHKK
ncbi:MAG TPA: hypothetical protein VK464_00575 [Symbiobacteriaceae bacterium]|nr:hypothetical protein [Symbiobacteriaceae bacterium]